MFPNHIQWILFIFCHFLTTLIDLPNFYDCFVTILLMPGSVFRLKKEENCEDGSECDPEENTAGEQP